MGEQILSKSFAYNAHDPEGFVPANDFPRPISDRVSDSQTLDGLWRSNPWGAMGFEMLETFSKNLSACFETSNRLLGISTPNDDPMSPSYDDVFSYTPEEQDGLLVSYDFLARSFGVVDFKSAIANSGSYKLASAITENPGIQLEAGEENPGTFDIARGFEIHIDITEPHREFSIRFSRRGMASVVFYLRAHSSNDEMFLVYNCKNVFPGGNVSEPADKVSDLKDIVYGLIGNIGAVVACSISQKRNRMQIPNDSSDAAERPLHNHLSLVPSSEN